MDGSETSVVLHHLSSLTEYQLAVFAIYANEASEALRGSETTCKFILTHKHTCRNVLQNLTQMVEPPLTDTRASYTDINDGQNFA